MNEHKGIFASMKDSIIESFANADLGAGDVIRYVSCFGAGFVLGLVLRRYFKQIIALSIFTILLISLLDYVHFISLNHNNIKIAMGFAPAQTYHMILSEVLTRAQNHMVEIGCAFLGCLLGFKVG